MKTKSALQWYGSDSQVAPQLASMINDRKHVTIPFAGGLAILPHLTATHVVVNDLHSEAINFYRCLSGRLGEPERLALISQCKSTLSHPAELDLAKTLQHPGYPVVDRAWAFWAQCWIGRKGCGGTDKVGLKASVRRTPIGGGNATRIRSVINDLEAWSAHFERCEFESIDFAGQLEKAKDREDCAIYVDPPWVDEGGAYKYSFTAQDHGKLCGFLEGFTQAKVLVRYGDNDLIRSLYHGWNIEEVESRSQANGEVKEIWLRNW
jgi:site-specific DNA-adenine methylase